MDWVSPEPNSGCWLWTGGQTTCGYGKAYIRGDKDRAAHRLFYKVFVGPIPEGQHVLHKCDVPLCCNPEHLFLGSHDDNIQDMVKKNRHIKKLSASKVRAIRDLLGCGWTQESLAREYGVTQSSISHIQNGKSWTHVA